MALASWVRLWINLTNPDQHQRRLALRAFHGDEPHRQSIHCLTEGFSIGGVVLAALDIRLNILWRNEFYLMSKRLQKSGPMMGSTAHFDRPHSWWQFLEEGDHLLAPQFFAQHGLLSSVYAMQLKDVL